MNRTSKYDRKRMTKEGRRFGPPLLGAAACAAIDACAKRRKIKGIPTGTIWLEGENGKRVYFPPALTYCSGAVQHNAYQPVRIREHGRK